MVLAALCAALTAVCAGIALPMGDISLTLQTFSLSLTLLLLGGKWGTVSILIYLLLGTAGAPVFSGFQGGFGVLLGVTGGYLWGFLPGGAAYWALEKLSKPLGLLAFFLCCYLCGSLWFTVYAGDAGFGAAVLKCVVPYLIPDGVKAVLALILARRIRIQGNCSGILPPPAA